MPPLEQLLRNWLLRSALFLNLRKCSYIPAGQSVHCDHSNVESAQVLNGQRQSSRCVHEYRVLYCQSSNEGQVKVCTLSSSRAVRTDQFVDQWMWTRL